MTDRTVTVSAQLVWVCVLDVTSCSAIAVFGPGLDSVALLLFNVASDRVEVDLLLYILPSSLLTNTAHTYASISWMDYA